MGTDMNITYKNTILNISLFKGDAAIEMNNEIFNEIFKTVVEERSKIEKEIIKNPLFKYSLEPVEGNNVQEIFFRKISLISSRSEEIQEIIRRMCHASNLANVGPMASVAGAIAEILAEKCLKSGFTAGIIENGGDIALFGDRNFKVKIYARNSPFSNKIFISVNPKQILNSDKILGLCTSSASVGPSMSFGESDATTIIAESPAIADAYATALGNLVQYNNIEHVIDLGKKFSAIKGICIIVKDRIGMWNVNFEKIASVID